MNTRRTEAEVVGFHASPALTENLQKIPVDLIELHLQGKQLMQTGAESSRVQPTPSPLNLLQ